MLREEPAVRLPEDTCRDDQVQTEEINVQRWTAGRGDKHVRGPRRGTFRNSKASCISHQGFHPLGRNEALQQTYALPWDYHTIKTMNLKKLEFPPSQEFLVRRKEKVKTEISQRRNNLSDQPVGASEAHTMKVNDR